MTALTSLAPALNLPTALPFVHAPMLGPEWLDATFIIKAFVGWIGPWAILGVMLVIFAETGLLIGFFLPGDSLLFTLGMFVAIGETNPAQGVPVPIWVAAPLVWLAAVAGNQTGYLIGRKAGPAIFNKPDSRLFKQEYVDRTSDFFERHGGKAVTLAQFVPIVRTLHPGHRRRRQDALPPLHHLQHPGRHLLGLRHHLVGLLPGNDHRGFRTTLTP